ncbi:hypothetical protein [uncultured Anaerococcus sp.]|mgnify:CR=1 FL=1|uniref:hypothetical protein n=1 Tax=uncultured Anaerococcus sp. TaxID=293428 RepID=UPI0025E81EAC|nr:hypothetical protein [uncultured Anaerococcus sp.]
MNIKTRKLLKKIKQQKELNTKEQLEYWRRELENNSNEEELLRNRFKELKEEGMINIFWADDLPQYTTITEKGISYCYFLQKGK